MHFNERTNQNSQDRIRSRTPACITLAVEGIGMNSTTIRLAILTLGAFALAAQQPAATPAGGTETVISTYRVRAGKEAEFEKVHAQAWPAYRRFGLVAAIPHLALQGVDEAGKPYV